MRVVEAGSVCLLTLVLATSTQAAVVAFGDSLSDTENLRALTSGSPLDPFLPLPGTG